MIYHIYWVWLTAFAWAWHGIGWAATSRKAAIELTAHPIVLFKYIAKRWQYRLWCWIINFINRIMKSD